MSFEELMNLATRKGFFLRSSDSYSSTPAGFWDYGPLGVAFKNRYIELWRRLLVRRDEMIEIDTAQIMPKDVFVASGHLASFSDPIVECSKCHSIYRADRLIQDVVKKTVSENLSDDKYDQMLSEHAVRCTNCRNPLTGTRRFNMMFRVGIGPIGEEAYLRPETCQGIFVDFPFLFKTQRIRLPIGVAQVGKSFRNEIAPRQGILRQREFYQAEIEVFFDPETVDSVPKFSEVFDQELSMATSDRASARIKVSEAIARGLLPNRLVGYYLHLIESFYISAGIDASQIRLRRLSDEEKAFYSSVAYDLEVITSVGWLELVACNYRSDHDLTRHQEVSRTDFRVNDNGKKVLPQVFELSMGVDRSLYALLEKAYRKEDGRSYLALKPYIAPLQVCVFPLLTKDGLTEEATTLYRVLRNRFETSYDESGSIGRRYARADEAGVPFCVTIDHQSLADRTVTLRDRDSKKQERVSEAELVDRLDVLTSLPQI